MSFLPRSLAICVALQLLGPAKGSMVQLKDNGYEDLVIAINPGLPEDGKIIDNIKAMVTEASTYLFQATHRRAYFKTVKILIPLTWKHAPAYLQPKTESFDKADVIIAEPFLKYGDDPYTLQYGGCGEPAKYIHFTPNFMTNDTVLQVYGPRGRVFVHEWAHLRWGVFDEYNNDRPFYISGSIKVEATRCSKDVHGIHGITECKGRSCTTRQCMPDTSTGLLEEGCTFIPEKYQTTTASIMYMQSLSTVVEFCDSSTHNTEAPNLQNRMCSSRSTWDVIMNSTDFKGVSPMGGTNLPAPPMFSLLQSRDRVVCLVLDISGSMSSSDRITRQYQASELFILQIIESGSFVGIVTFHSYASEASPLRQIIHEKSRRDLVSYLPKTPAGGTNICAGILKGLEVNRQNGNTFGTEIVLLTDGEDGSDTRRCIPDVTNSGVIVHIIALGPNAERALEEIATLTGGLRFLATDKLDTNGLADAFSGISSGNGNLSQQSIQLESNGLNVISQQCLAETVDIDSTVGNDTFFVVTWEVSTPAIEVVDPRGHKYSNKEFALDTTSKTARLSITGTAQAGIWKYKLCNTYTSAQALGITVTSRAANNNVPPITVKAHMNQDTTAYPNPMVVYAEVSQGFLPVVGANVTAIIDPEKGDPLILNLADNGSGADIAKNDGIYSRFFTEFKANGRYSLRVRVQGKDKTTKLGLRMQRSQALYVPGYIENGVFNMNPLRPALPDDDIQANLESFSRTASGGSFVVSAVPSGPAFPDIFPPCKITDLEARIEENKIDLSWTAPGGDLDAGQAAWYDIRMSTNPLELRDHFEKTTSVNASNLTPQPAGSAETFSFIPQNLSLANGTIIYFAVRAIDDAALQAEVSNTAQAARFIPSPMTPTSAPPPTTFTPAKSDSSSNSVILLTLIVCSTAVLISLVISITLCILSCNSKKTRPQTEL
ncbi:calcium-activated chloride channel regulator 1-like [Ambystoma mexicanum]|uniref:calcium-activated chloride channel regulator 1-like n=1 Tax=Ambystoma mexicanum TaxID=8296 RepID=UPI0037E987C6